MIQADSYASYQKSPYRSVKHSTYFDTYDHLFGPYRNRPITFVEIGVLGGGSLFMWRDFLGPDARIIGVDLNPNARKWEAHGFEIFIGSQSDEAFWAGFKRKVGPMDVVLDDGGHTYEQQILTTECLLDGLADGGILVVEDTHTSYMQGFGAPRFSFMAYVKQVMDGINYRFGQFSDERAETRVWSVEIMESMVAFRVNHQATALKSEPTDNQGQDDQATDFRYEGNIALKRHTRIERKLRHLDRIPLVRRLSAFIKRWSAEKRFKSTRFFWK
ncbi:MAG: hypothetical protein CMN28_03990 [Salinisphaeraceae bacterium]|jgi:hypothetical protein|nr:hypothetical protein [Salinisphaeraceae bacterium]